MEQKRGLGKGLSALIPDIEGKGKARRVIDLDVNFIISNPYQPRKKFDPIKIEEIMLSIKEKGLIQPIIVSKIGEEKYRLIVGERRLLAIKKLGWEKIPAIVTEVEDDKDLLEKSLIENVQRESLTPIEEAYAYKKLIDEFGYNLDEISKVIGKDKSTISNTIRLLQLPSEVLEEVEERKITPGHARAILMLNTKEEQIALLQRIINKKLTVREAEKQALSKRKVKKSIAVDPNITSVLEEVQRKIGAKIEINYKKKGGSIVIRYIDNKDLERILNCLSR